MSYSVYYSIAQRAWRIALGLRLSVLYNVVFNNNAKSIAHGAKLNNQVYVIVQISKSKIYAKAAKSIAHSAKNI